MTSLEHLLELRETIEEKIVNAPTVALKNKYRTKLKEIELQIEIHASSSSDATLPVLQKGNGDEVSAIDTSTRADKINRAKVPFRLAGNTFYTAEDLGVFLNTTSNWDIGLDEFRSGRLGDWISKQFSDPYYQQIYNELHADKNMGSEADLKKFLLSSLILNPKGTIHLAGSNIEMSDLMGNSSLPKWVARITGDKHLVFLQESLVQPPKILTMKQKIYSGGFYLLALILAIMLWAFISELVGM